MLIGKYEKATCCLEDGWRVLFTPHREAMYGVCDVLLQEEEGMYIRPHLFRMEFSEMDEPMLF